MPWLWNRAGSDGGIASGVRGATNGREAIAEDIAAFVQSGTVARRSRSRHRRNPPGSHQPGGTVAQILYIQVSTTGMRALTHQTIDFLPGFIYSAIFIGLVALYARE